MRLAALAVLLLLAAAALPAADYPGFSLAPPPGEGWRQVQHDARSLVWMRRTSNPRITFSVALLTGSADPRARPDFLAWLGAVKRANPEPDRYALELTRLEPEPGLGPDCARYGSVITERGRGDAALVLAVEGLACLHPEAPGRYFDIQYSFRHPAALAPDPEDAAAGEAFLEGFGFCDPPPGGDWALAPGISRMPERERT